MSVDWGLWHRRLEESRRVRRELWAPQARDSVALYEGRIPDATVGLNDVPVNIAATYIRALVAVVYANDPSFVVFPTNEESEKSAPVLQQLLSYWWRAFGLKREIRLSLIDALLMGCGWMEYGYQAEFGVEGDSHKPESTQGIADKILKSIVGLGKRGEDRKTEQGHVIEFNEFIQKESLFGRRLNPFAILTPVGVNDYRYYPWLGYEFTIAEEDLDHYPRLSKFKHQLTPMDKRARSEGGIREVTYTPAAIPSGVGKLTVDRPYRFVKLWDKRTQKRMIFGDGVMEPLISDDWPYGFDGFPITCFAPLPIPETDQAVNGYPISALQTAKPLLREMTKLYTAMSENRKRFPTKVLFDEMVSDDVVNWIANEDTGGAIKVRGLADKPTLVRELTMRTNQSNLQAEYQLISHMLEVMLNVNLLSGTPATGVDTATEAAGLQQALMAQVRELQDKVEDFVEEGAYRMLNMREFIDEEQVFKITADPRAAQSWVRIVPSNTPGDYGVRVEVGSTGVPREMAIIRKQLFDFANMALPYHQSGLLAMDFDRLFKRAAMTFPPEVIRNVDEIFETGEEEEAALIQQENELLLAGLPAAVHPRDNHVLHIQGHGGPDGTQGGATPAMAMHIMQHNQFVEGKVQSNGSLVSGSTNAANPTATRSAGTFPDIVQGLRNAGKGTGAETNERGLGP